MTVEITVLDNGLTVATDRMDTVESLSVGAWIGVGTRHEPAQVNGVAHLLEHMLFKGTERRSAQQIAEEIEAVGGHLNAYTGREVTAYYAKVLAEDSALAIDMIADLLQHSVFDQQELARERTVVLQEIGQAQDTPDDIVFDYFQETAYPDQPLGWPVLGRPEVVRQLSRDDLIAYRAGRYGAKNMIFAAAGRLEHARIVELAQAAFTDLPPGEAVETPPPSYLGGDFRESRDLEQAHLLLGFEGFGFLHSDYYAGSVFSTLLGGGMSSRLFQEVRERRGLVYSIFSFLSAQGDSGLFGIYAGTGEAEVAELMPVVVDELAKVAAADVSEAELKRAKAQLKASILMGRERSSHRAEQLANHLLIYGEVQPVEEIVARIEAVDAAAIRRVAEQLTASRPTLTGLGPLGRLESYDRLTARLGASDGAAARAAV